MSVENLYRIVLNDTEIFNNLKSSDAHNAFDDTLFSVSDADTLKLYRNGEIIFSENGRYHYDN